MLNTSIYLVALSVFLSCGEEKSSEPDATTFQDSGVSDDAGELPDAAIFPRAGFGQISGDCDVLDDELVSGESGIFQLAIDFSSLYSDSDLNLLTSGGQKIIADGNAGGSSLLSEVFAFEVLQRCEDATLLKTENEIAYDTEGKITDLLTEIDGEKIGVSVTRAVAFPFADPYPLSKAQDLLSDKLGDILRSSAKVGNADRWGKQILAILAFSPAHGDVLLEAFGGIPSETRSDTLVVVIVTNGSDDFIYCNGLCE